MFVRFRDKPPFDSWQTEVLRDYCDYALQPEDETGLLTLACDPVNEAALYMAQAGNEVILDELSLLTVPVTVLRAPPGPFDVMDFSASPTWPGLADALPRGRDVYLPDHNHFIPMQDPALVARYIDEAQADRWQRL
jgi:pimeloyl-ACP methyl ester carboxylesterase